MEFGPQVIGPLSSSHSTSSPQQPRLKEARYGDLRYTKFNIEGYVGEKHAVFIPDSMSLTLPLLKQICAALDKQVPSLLLSGMSSLCHTARLSNQQLRKCKGFTQLMEEAEISIVGECAGNHHAKLVEVVNRVLEKKVVTAVGCIAAAAQRTNAWVYSGPQITNFEMFLQQCIESGETEVFRMAVAHMQDKAYTESYTSMELMKELFDNSQEMSPEGVSYFQPILLKGDLWDPGVCNSNPEFAEFGFDHWSFTSYDQKMAHGHPISLWPWPHASLFLLFYRENGSGKNEVNWQFRTSRRHDPEAMNFNPEVLAPMGHIFFGTPVSWGTRMKKTLLQGMKVTRPVVLMDNTPNIAKQLSLCVNSIKKVWERAPLAACRPFLDDASGSSLGSTPTSSEILQALSPSKILQYVKDSFDSSGMDVNERLSLSDIVGLLDIAKRRPRAFRETVCVLDPLADPSESVALLMSTFMSHQTGWKEANPSTVHRSLVLKAWGLHLRLSRNELQLRRLVTATVVLTALALVISTSIAMLMVSLRVEGERVTWWSRYAPQGLHIACVALPICAALLTIIWNNFQITQKWAEAHMAASKVVSEIYYFLGSVGPYDSGSTTSQRRFLRRLRSMGRRVSGPWMREEDLAGGWEKVFRDEPERLQQHISSSLYAARAPCCPSRCLRGFAGSLAGSFAWTRLLLEDDPHDMVAPVTAETYMEVRMIPLKSYFADMMRGLVRLRLMLHAALVCLVSASMALAMFGLPSLIPIVLSLAVFIASVMPWVAPSETFTALASVLDTLNGFEMRWQGTDIVENRSLATKVHFITMTERLALRVARSLSPATLLPDLAEGEDEEAEADAADDKASEANMMEQRSRPISIMVTPPQEQSTMSSPSTPPPLETPGRRASHLDAGQ